jgi:hypothetical protein
MGPGGMFRSMRTTGEWNKEDPVYQNLKGLHTPTTEGTVPIGSSSSGIVSNYPSDNAISSTARLDAASESLLASLGVSGVAKPVTDISVETVSPGLLRTTSYGNNRNEEDFSYDQFRGGNQIKTTEQR